MERGTLLHAALAAFWDDVGDHATLRALADDPDGALAARIHVAVATAHAAIPASRWHDVAPAIVAADSGRLERLLASWLTTVELVRPPFRVRAVEQRVTLALGTLELGMTIDRVDALPAAAGSDADGATLAIIDYKSGATTPVAHWLLPRPRAPQPALYALATLAAEPEAHVSALAFAQVKPGALLSRGIADDAAAWKGLMAPAKASAGRFDSLEAMLEGWYARYADLVTDYQRGNAAVAPRGSPRPCKTCEFGAICRIAATVQQDDDEDDTAVVT
jgi:hypothetical protein